MKVIERRCRSRRGAVLGLLAMALHAPAGGQSLPGEDEPPPPLEPVALADLATAADLVALVQVLDTDYEYARDFPIGGTAFLRILIPYKLDRPLPDIVEVYDEGLREGECYFPNPPVTEEGRRYLLFVRRNPEVEGQYLGMEEGCALTALVTVENRYALRYPAEGIDISDDLSSLAVGERIELVSEGLVEERDDRTYKLTHGVPIGAVRTLLGAENLTTDRSLLRPAPVTEEN